jgi:o-succinylbenzoate synthase
MDLKTRLKIIRGGTRSFELPLVRPLSTAHGRIESRAGFLLCLMDEEGRYGFGEATPLPEFGTEDLSTTERALERALGDLVDRTTRSIEEALAVSAGVCFGAPCALSALDGALHDLASQRAGRSLCAWIRDRAGLPGEPARRISVQALVVGDEAESVAASAKDSLKEGFETFKLKLAVSPSQPDFALDLVRVAALREVIGPTRRIRLDANEAWGLKEAEAALEALARFDIDYVEQPVAREDHAALKYLDLNTGIPVAADEALLGTGWQDCLESRAASIFVVKPAALGGITASMALFRRARDLGIRVVWSSLIDGAVGRATAVALAAGLARAGKNDDAEVHGLGTAKLLARDLIEGCEVVRGGIESDGAVGLGCDLAPVWESGSGVRDACSGEVRIVEAKR